MEKEITYDELYHKGWKLYSMQWPYYDTGEKTEWKLLRAVKYLKNKKLILEVNNSGEYTLYIAELNYDVMNSETPEPLDFKVKTYSDIEKICKENRIELN